MKSEVEKEIELKNIIQWIINKVFNIINLVPFRQNVNTFIDQEYQKGLERAEVQFDMNFVSNDKDVQFLNNYVNDNIQAAGDDLGNSLRGELSRGLQNGESISQLKTRVRTTFNDKKFDNRLKAILRTEKLRANNYGALDGAKQSGLKLKKYLDVIMDDRTSDICKAENRKYGTKEQAIPLDKEFVVKVNNKTYRSQAPPFHVNCRTILRFVRIKND